MTSVIKVFSRSGGRLREERHRCQFEGVTAWVEQEGARRLESSPNREDRRRQTALNVHHSLATIYRDQQVDRLQHTHLVRDPTSSPSALLGPSTRSPGRRRSSPPPPSLLLPSSIFSIEPHLLWPNQLSSSTRLTTEPLPLSLDFTSIRESSLFAHRVSSPPPLLLRAS